MLNRILRIGEDGIQYEADPRRADILVSMLATSTSPVSSPGVRVSSDKPLVHGCRNPPTMAGGGAEHLERKIFSLDGDIDEWEAGWGSEENEEWYGEGRQEGGARVHPYPRWVRPGRRERAAAIGEEGDEGREGQGSGEDGDALLSSAEETLFRATAARANYLALDRPDLAFAAKELCRRMSAPRQRDRQALRRLCW